MIWFFRFWKKRKQKGRGEDRISRRHSTVSRVSNYRKEGKDFYRVSSDREAIVGKRRGRDEALEPIEQPYKSTYRCIRYLVREKERASSSSSFSTRSKHTTSNDLYFLMYLTKIDFISPLSLPPPPHLDNPISSSPPLRSLIELLLRLTRLYQEARVNITRGYGRWANSVLNSLDRPSFDKLLHSTYHRIRYGMKIKLVSLVLLQFRSDRIRSIMDREINNETNGARNTYYE